MGKKRQDPEKTSPAAKKAKTERPVDPEPHLKRKPGGKTQKEPVDPAKRKKEPKPGEKMTGKDEEPIGGGIEPKPSDPLESLRAERARWIQDLRNIAVQDKRMTVPENGVLQSVGWGPYTLCALPVHCV